MKQTAKYTPELLNMALVGLEQARKDIDSRMADVRVMLLGVTLHQIAPKTYRGGSGPKTDAARKAISAAQKRRWDEWRKAKARVSAKRSAA